MAFDGYNWGTVQTGSTWRPFTSITGTIYAGLAAKGKPIMIPETASTELGGDKAAWIAAILPALKTSLPAIKALVWFHMNKETDWRINSSLTAQAAFVPMARDAVLQPLRWARGWRWARRRGPGKPGTLRYLNIRIVWAHGAESGAAARRRTPMNALF